ncbi:MAG TPA: multidrug DMT transporter permease, partial [Clostridiales bacterium]|nr:multidrug DMT transporter permease [Clostridiales bacterium]
ATAISWLCYYYAIAKGQVSVVVPIDKLSVLFTVIMSIFIFKEKPTLKLVIGLLLLTAGTICMAIFT